MDTTTKKHIKIAIDYIEKTLALIDDFIEKHGDLYDDGADEYCFQIYLVLQNISLELLELCGIEMKINTYAAQVVPNAIKLLKAYMEED